MGLAPRPGKITLRFIGEDRSMGLRKGKIYIVRIYSYLGHIIVCLDENGDKTCPYRNLKMLCENWESVE